MGYPQHFCGTHSVLWGPVFWKGIHIIFGVCSPCFEGNSSVFCGTPSVFAEYVQCVGRVPSACFCVTCSFSERGLQSICGVPATYRRDIHSVVEEVPTGCWVGTRGVFVSTQAVLSGNSQSLWRPISYYGSAFWEGTRSVFEGFLSVFKLSCENKARDPIILNYQQRLIGTKSKAFSKSR